MSRRRKGRRRSRVALILNRIAPLAALVLSLPLAGAGPASGATNGRILFHAPLNCIVGSVASGGSGFNCVLLGGSTELAGPGGEPSAAPDNGHITFTDRDQAADIAVMNADGTGIRQLTSFSAPAGSAARGDRRSSWSPDGRRIAYSQYDTLQAGVYVMNADGSGQRLVAAGGRGVPSFTPDGGTLAFERYQKGIFLVDSAGGNDRVILADRNVVDPATNQRTFETNTEPRFSPDGRRIVFTRRTVVSTPGSSPVVDIDIYVMNADGSGVTRLTSTPTVDESSPSFSPDSTKIVYVRRAAGVSDYELTVDNARVAVMNADGSGQQEIAPGGEPFWSSITAGPRSPRLTVSGLPRGCFRLNTPLLKITKELGLTFKVKTTASRQTSIQYTMTVDGQEVGFGDGFLNPPPRKHKRGQPNDVWSGGGGIPIFEIRKSGSTVKVVIDVGGVEQISRSFHVRRC
jgi:WD40-like Beta Propeller Repeat